ncbi:hypothetical protein N8I77_007564 [Diaporthe amygdali]|uniref:Uncharacterized protein n=1 Tax=Phomopsis amygdali TaxID=1214568 RepID=A0AAD9SBY2_PHOAM|nr:hypothetical protein N8I77_007564 [Diaporthe amygdali]
MFLLVGPEMALGRPKAPQGDMWTKTPLPQPQQLGDIDKPQKMLRSSMSTISLRMKAAKSAIRRSTSLRGSKPVFTNRSIIVDDAPSLAPIRIHSPINLNKPLPDLPEDGSSRSGPESIAANNGIETDVSVRDFEGYLDMLAYVNRQLPIIPTPLYSPTRDVSSSPSLSINSPPKEDEWISSRPQSRTSTIFSHNDEVRRVRTHSGLLSRNSPAGRTVTPMSSLGSESGLRISTRASLPTSVVTSRIDELSEPETSPSLTPKNNVATTPKQCCHCGRDPTGRDTKDMDSTPLAAVKTQDVMNINSSPLTVINIREHEKNWERKTVGPSITAEDQLGRRFVLYPETSYFEALDGLGKESIESSAQRTPPSREVSPSSPLTPSPYTRPLNPDPYADENSPSKRVVSPFERPSNPSPCASSSSPLSEPIVRDKEMDNGQDNPDKDEDQKNSDKENLPSFWKDPDGTIVVYEGIARDGDEVFYGSDINYLGSFYDCEEGSSGLGSVVDLVGLSSGLHVIPEDRSSEDLAMWDSEVLTFG